MSLRETQFITVGEGAGTRRIAYLASAAEPGKASVLWLIGLKSDMTSTKAEALAEWTHARGMGLARFDYSGHGQSEGRFEEALISDWVEEAEAVLKAVISGPVIIAGSSTGGHVALLLLKRLMERNSREAERVLGLVLIAPAWDLTEELMWKKYPEEVKREILEKGRWVQPSAYDPNGYVITRSFIEDGRKDLLLGAGFNPGRPVRVLQGAQDPDVPIGHALQLKDVLLGDWVSFEVVPDGEHRLSRPEDIEKLFRLVEGLT